MKLLRRASIRPRATTTTDELVLFFSSDIHGSDVCWRKFINAAKAYKANVLIMGGDLTGKAVVPIIRAGSGTYRVDFMGRREVVTEDGMEASKAAIRYNGLYPYICDPEEALKLADPGYLNQVFVKVISEELIGWLSIAQERLEPSGVALYVMPGNDDEFFIDDLLAENNWVINPDRRVVPVAGFQLLSCSWVPPTPWDSSRECSEEELAATLHELERELDPMHPMIFNLHSPPYRTGLDDAPLLNEDLSMSLVAGQPRMVPVGSHAVRDIIERLQPAVALHGHIHESRGIAKLGTTKCVNPGSSYGVGTLDGCLVKFSGEAVRSIQLVRG
jgi:uncharacterized protein